MRTIGLIGGMSWESTVSYYQQINQAIKSQLGGLHSAKIVLNSVDFAQIERLQHQGSWLELASILIEAAQKLELAGAECVVICTNTMHKVADQVASSIAIPLLHIADATATKLVEDRKQMIGLLGTKFTMEQEFYTGRLEQKYAIDVVLPDAAQRQLVHDVIYQELCLGAVRTESKAAYLAIIDDLAAQGAQGVILGCTEIALLVKQQDTTVALYDTTAIHADFAVQFALA